MGAYTHPILNERDNHKMENGIYQNLYNLVAQYVYGGVDLTPEMELVNVAIRTLGCLFIVALPFLVLYLILRLILRG